MSSDAQIRKIGLAGANGFIGSAILRQLRGLGLSPCTLCGPETPEADRADYLLCDLTDTKRLMGWVDGLEVVIHAAGPPSVRQSFEMPEEYVRVHVQGTTALLQACRAAQVKKIVYLSSAEVYGRATTNPVAETHRLQPRSPYAAAKIAAEKMIEAYAESFGLSAIVLRPFSIYGPKPTSESLFGTILSMAKQGFIRLHDLRPVRDYCYVDDVAVAVARACSLPNDGLKFFNIGTGKGTSVADFTQCVLQALGLDLPVIEERSRSRSQAEILELIADATAAQSILGWMAKIDLHDGLRRAIGAS
jgi:nucleoside-diphosphate-sugar epimerase